MLVVTADQKGSRSGRDRVPQVLQSLENLETYRPFQRTAGDEIQGVFQDAKGALEAARILFQDGGWYVGIGGGEVELPLPANSRDGRGQAFVMARHAVEAAKRSFPAIEVRADRGQDDANALLGLLGALWEKRTDRGWQAVRQMENTSDTQMQVATQMGISEQALSQRLKAALWQVELRSLPLVEKTLAAAGGESSYG